VHLAPSFERRPALGTGAVAVIFVPASSHGKPRVSKGTTGTRNTVFFFFSNRLGCLGSLFVSLVVTAIIVLLISALN